MDRQLAKTIDHTLLKADATEDEIKQICEEAKKYSFASVCVNPVWVKYCHSLLQDSDVKVCTVIGFPLGASTTETKVFETTNAISNGATEIDMVLAIGALKNKDTELVEKDIRAVVEAANGQALTKVIIETSLLTQDEKILACQLAVKAGADYVKTSTGFSTGGATVDDIRLMRSVVGPNVGVKASGGVRNRTDAENMIAAGATRIGASAGVAIVNE